MDSTYKGDSPGKALVRFRAWAALRDLALRMRIPYRGALVLAGEGGDLGVLQGLGFDMSKVVAVDRDPFLVEWCKHHHPEIQTHTGDIIEVVRDHDVPYNVAHLDFCGGIRLVDNIRTMAEVAANVYTHPALIAVTMLKGREGKASDALMAGVPRTLRRRAQLAARKRGDALGEHICKGGAWDSLTALALMKEKMRAEVVLNKTLDNEHRMVKRNGNLTGLGMAQARATVLHHAVEWLWEVKGPGRWFKESEGNRICMQQMGLMTYHSGDKERGDAGTPFMTCIYLVYRSSQHDWLQYWLHEHFRVAEERDQMVIPYREFDLKACMESLKPTIAALGRKLPHARVAAMFGIKEKSIPAIIAHDSRGSYKGQSIVKLANAEYDSDPEDLGWGSMERRR